MGVDFGIYIHIIIEFKVGHCSNNLCHSSFRKRNSKTKITEKQMARSLLITLSKIVEATKQQNTTKYLSQPNLEAILNSGRW